MCVNHSKCSCRCHTGAEGFFHCWGECCSQSNVPYEKLVAKESRPPIKVDLAHLESPPIAVGHMDREANIYSMDIRAIIEANSVKEPPKEWKREVLGTFVPVSIEGKVKEKP